MANLLTIISAVVAALGGLIYGVDSGIIATTIGHDTFKLYMFGPSMTNTALTGALVSVYNAGQSVGSATVGYLADRFSRKYTISLAAALATFGALLQTVAQNIGMMIAGRLIAGIACGMILSAGMTYPSRNSKIAHG
jgi:MFS family permease